ncbi:MAG: sensor histidine kinase [Bacteroidetes bacterium]|jgi:two-component system phosphate regulon sensor histidine kinase PhoR|nr:sensor histidine kinase [Bacteroidota bacterium]
MKNNKTFNLVLLLLLFVLFIGLMLLFYLTSLGTDRLVLLGGIVIVLIIFILYYFFLNYWMERYVRRKVSLILQEIEGEQGKSTSKTVVTDIESLTREVERFARDKQSEIDALNILENYRKEFMGNVAHELRTPLFTVQGYILTLMEGAKNDPEILTKYLEGAAKGVERLTRIVNDLDLISRLESGQQILDKSVFNLRKMIENVIDLLEMKASKKNISLNIETFGKKNFWVYADAEKTEQVLINLIDNSIKYGKKKGTTEITIEDFSKEKYLVRITDNGVGIAKENLNRVFERFYRVDKTGSRKEGGSGLGLSIVKYVLEAHNEKIFIDSQLGIGSEFSFTIQKKTD